MNLDQTTPTGQSDLDLRCLLKRLQNIPAYIHVHCKMRFKGLLSQDFCFEMCTRFKQLIDTLPESPFCADEIAQSSPGMNIEVAASKLYYTLGYTNTRLLLTPFLSCRTQFCPSLEKHTKQNKTL